MAWEPDYVTLDEFKNYVGIELSQTDDDDIIALDITAGSRAVDRCCSNRRNGLGAFRQFGKTEAPESRYYTPRWDLDQMRWVVEIDDLMDDTGLSIVVDTSNQGTFTESVTDYVLRPRNAPRDNRPWTQIAISPASTVQPARFPDSVRVTADVWGWTEFPSTIVRATLLQTHRFNKRRASPFGVKGSPQRGTLQTITEEVDADVAAMLNSNNFVKLGWTV